MDCCCTNTDTIIYFECRKKAAVYNERLRSRESAAEYLGISVSSLANYELGITTPPADIVIRMADLYSSPELKNLHCKNECPLGKEQTLAVEVKSLESVTLSILSKLDDEEVTEIKKQLLIIASDGKVNPDEEEFFQNIVDEFDKLALAIGELKLIRSNLAAKKKK